MMSIPYVGAINRGSLAIRRPVAMSGHPSVKSRKSNARSVHTRIFFLLQMKFSTSTWMLEKIEQLGFIRCCRMRPVGSYLWILIKRIGRKTPRLLCKCVKSKGFPRPWSGLVPGTAATYGSSSLNRLLPVGLESSARSF